MFNVPTSTGRVFPHADGGWDDFRTPTGEFAIQRKPPTRHMAATDVVASDGYDLAGVPWVSYLLWWGISFHGTYWHNDFGRVHSHGCIRLWRTAARREVAVPLVAAARALRPGICSWCGHQGGLICEGVTEPGPTGKTRYSGVGWSARYPQRVCVPWLAL